MLVSNAHAETYKLQCIYEKGGKKIITIDEENKKITNSPALYGGPWNYRKMGEYIYIYEIAVLKAQMIYRFIID